MLQGRGYALAVPMSMCCGGVSAALSWAAGWLQQMLGSFKLLVYAAVARLGAGEGEGSPGVP